METIAPTSSAPLEAAGDTADRKVPSDEKSLKRKASVDDDDDEKEEGEISSPKRTRRDSDASDSKYPRVEKNAGQRQVAKQEEKKRGQRLFGGLLSTLSQKPSLAQQKRRQEIEKRQQEKMHRQDAEDDVKRSQKLAKLREIRMTEQIVFEEEVMKNRHSKELRLARFLSTKARPTIYYLPWKCTNEQEDIIDEQISRAKELIQRQEDLFRHKRQKHIDRYGEPKRQPRVIERERLSSRSTSRSRSRSASQSRSRSPPPQKLPNPSNPTPDGPPQTTEPVKDSKKDEQKNGSEGIESQPTEVKATAKEPTPTAPVPHDHHDEADIMEEGDEDAVIY